MESTKYASVRVKVETYREMKQVALDAGIPFTRLMDEMLMAYKEKLAKDAYTPMPKGRGITRFVIRRNGV